MNPLNRGVTRVLIAGCTAFVGVGLVTTAAHADPQIGYLRCLSEPQGAYVFLDGKWIGVTPLGPIGVVQGEHSLWFRTRPGAEFEPKPLAPHDITVQIGDTTRVHERMGHLVWLESDPTGASVVRDGLTEGTTPLQLRVDPERTKSITLGSPGYRVLSVDLARLGREERVSLSLRPDLPEARPLVARSPSRFRQWAPWGSMFLAAGGAAAAVHFKERADDAFENYESSLGAGDIDRWRRQAERDDRRATAAWIVTETALAFGVYLLAKPLFGDANRSASADASNGGTLVPNWQVDVAPERAGLAATWAW